MSLRHLPDDEFFYGIIKVLHRKSSPACECGEPAARGVGRCITCHRKAHASRERDRYALQKLQRSVGVLCLMLTTATATTIGLTDLRIEDPWADHHDLVYYIRLQLTAWEDAQ